MAINKIVATLRGVGKQVYDCDGASFKLREPVAQLFTSRGALAAIRGKGPFWANVDGSHVDGTLDKSVPSPSGPSNVAWLRLTGKSAPVTSGVFGNVTFIQRIGTRGGTAPATCTSPKTIAVDYSATDVFWAHK